MSELLESVALFAGDPRLLPKHRPKSIVKGLCAGQ